MWLALPRAWQAENTVSCFLAAYYWVNLSCTIASFAAVTNSLYSWQKETRFCKTMSLSVLSL